MFLGSSNPPQVPAGRDPGLGPRGLESPARLAARLKIGREEFCQRLLTSLILQGPYPRWNTRSAIAAPGIAFLRQVYRLSFPEAAWPDAAPVFVDEFELPARTDIEKGGAPDYAVVWEDRLWYFEFAHHYYPDASIDLTYLTPAMEYVYRPPGPWARFAHVTWEDLVPIITAVWPASDEPVEREVLQGLVDAIASLSSTPAVWRACLPAGPVAEPVDQWAAAVAEGVALATSTATDGEQRAIDYEAADLEDLLALRLAVRNALAASAEGAPLRRVMAWLWRPESLGEAMTAAGERNGMEVRLSRYAKALYERYLHAAVRSAQDEDVQAREL